MEKLHTAHRLRGFRYGFIQVMDAWINNHITPQVVQRMTDDPVWVISPARAYRELHPELYPLVPVEPEEIACFNDAFVQGWNCAVTIISEDEEWKNA